MSGELTPQQIAAEEQLLADLHKTERKSPKWGWLWSGMFFFFVWVPILVEMPQMPSPTVLQLWTPSGKDLGQTYLASEQECEEVRAELGSQFRSECIGIGSTVRKRQWRCWSAELAQKAESPGCAPSSVTDKPE